MKIKFNQPPMSSRSQEYLNLSYADLANDVFCKQAQALLQQHTKAKVCLLTHSCTGALEMSAILADIKAGDEIIMPSFTFVSTANAFVLRGAIPVFVDIRPDTLNMDEKQIESVVTNKTKAIVPVHYAGIACEMDAILSIAQKYNLFVIEDAAQGMLASYKNKHLGNIGHLGALSFHYTKNITSGLGGALLINDEKLIESAKIIWQKGTNREVFLTGQVDRYTWMDVGSSFMMSELSASLLCSQLEEVNRITSRRLEIWQQYYVAFKSIADLHHIKIPTAPVDCQHNAHIFYLILRNNNMRSAFIKYMSEKGIESIFHYIPLHQSPAGVKYGTTKNKLLSNTEDLSSRLVRLPLYPSLSDIQIQYIINSAKEFITNTHAKKNLSTC